MQAESNSRDDDGAGKLRKENSFTKSNPSGANSEREIRWRAWKDELNCSQSVADIVTDMSGSFTGAQFVAFILEKKSDYGPLDQRLEAIDGLRSTSSNAKQGSALDWARQSRSLIQNTQLLDGRLLLLCLVALNPSGTRVLRRRDLLVRIEHDFLENNPGKPLKSRLTPQGAEVFSIATFDDDATKTLSDAAADVDLLFREPFAEAISLRIRSMRAADNKRPLMIHLDGEWGAGKTTILGFIAKQLSGKNAAPTAAGQRWIVASYNAWQHQDLESPWWTIANSVLSQLEKAALARPETLMGGLRLLLRHGYFRVLSGRLGTVIAALMAVGAIFALITKFPITKSDDVDTALKIAATVFGFGLAGWNIFAARDVASQAYLNSRDDPMRALERHVRSCIEALPAPVVVMVDDIDRCLAGNVVKLLEGIQIMFGRAPVVFVFAGDRDWINCSFANIYKDFEQISSSHTRSLGHRFLEKTFQISIWVPDMTAEAKRRYWSAQLGVGVAAYASRDTPDLSSAQTESDILDAADSIDNANEATKMSYRLAAIRRLADPDIEARLDHTLLPFCDLAEPNPRSMKRLVMMYGIVRSIDILAGRRTPPSVLARWTLLLSRWPDLARWLQANPGRLNGRNVTTNDYSEDDLRYAALLKGSEVMHVLCGGNVEGPVLDETTLAELTSG